MNSRSAAEPISGAGVRPLGLASATCLVVASMIGTGVFTTSGFLLADLKSPWLVLLAWAVGGLLAALGALSYGALARYLPESGGEYLYLSKMVHPSFGYMAGWISLFAGFSAPLAAAAYGFGEYSRLWFPHASAQGTATAVTLICSAVHFFDVPFGARFQNATVVIKLFLIALFLGIAAVNLPPLPAVHMPKVPLGDFAVSLVWISFSYSGWNAAVYVAGEVSQPDRNLPRSLLYGAAIVTAAYLGLNAVFIFSGDPGQLAGKLQVGQIAARLLGGPVLEQFITVIIALALITSVSSLSMAGPRVYARMARDGFLPAIMARQSGPPRAAILLQTGIALMFLWTSTYQTLLTYIGFTLGLCTAGAVGGLIALRIRLGDKLPIPGGLPVPIIFVTSAMAITGFTIFQRPKESLTGLATIALGWCAWKFSIPRGRGGPQRKDPAAGPH